MVRRARVAVAVATCVVLALGAAYAHRELGSPPTPGTLTPPAAQQPFEAVALPAPSQQANAAWVRAGGPGDASSGLIAAVLVGAWALALVRRANARRGSAPRPLAVVLAAGRNRGPPLRLA